MLALYIVLSGEESPLKSSFSVKTKTLGEIFMPKYENNSGCSDESGVADRRDADDRRGAAVITLHTKCFHKQLRKIW